MKVLVTGGSGFIGSAVVPALVAEGHEVTALVRSERAAAAVRALGAVELRGELASLREALAGNDALVHLASGEYDEEVLFGAVAGSGKRLVHTSGTWMHGNTDGAADERAPFDPPPGLVWRPRVERRLREELGAVVIAPGVVYGHGRGLPNLLTVVAGERVLYPGTGEQHWANVHIDDLGVFYARALAKAVDGSYYLAVGDGRPTVGQLATAISRAKGMDGRVAAEPEESSKERLGPLYAAFTLDQRFTNARARAELGWEPTAPGLMTELADY